MGRIREVLTSLKTALWRRPSMGRLAVVAVVIACAAFFLWPEQIKWPDFPATENGAPAVVVQVERDFGYRIGDPVPVTVYVRQSPGTDFDATSLAVEGDFEIRTAPEVDTIDTKDGGKLIRIKLVLQSFAYKPEITAKFSGSWSVTGQREQKDLPAVSLSVFTSKTWDGRMQLQEGPQPFLQGWQVVKYPALLLAAILGWLWCTRTIRRLMNQVTASPAIDGVSPRQVARERFDAVWAKIQAGDQSAENFKEIDLIVRQFLRIETVLRTYVPLAVGENHPYLTQIVLVIDLCEKVMYQGGTLTPAELESLKKAFDDFILRR